MFSQQKQSDQKISRIRNNAWRLRECARNINEMVMLLIKRLNEVLEFKKENTISGEVRSKNLNIIRIYTAPDSQMRTLLIPRLFEHATNVNAGLSSIQIPPEDLGSIQRANENIRKLHQIIISTDHEIFSELTSAHHADLTIIAKQLNDAVTILTTLANTADQIFKSRSNN